MEVPEMLITNQYLTKNLKTCWRKHIRQQINEYNCLNYSYVFIPINFIDVKSIREKQTAYNLDNQRRLGLLSSCRPCPRERFEPILEARLFLLSNVTFFTETAAAERLC